MNEKHNPSYEASPDSPFETPGILYGTVENVVMPDNVCYVKFDQDNTKTPTSMQCVWAAGALSGLLGINTTFVPSRGTRVLVLTTGGEPGIIVGTFGDPMFSNMRATPRHVTTQPVDLDYHKQQHFQVLKQRVKQTKTKDNIPNVRNSIYDAQRMPRDMTEGEMEISNTLNVGLQLMRHFTKLGAGDMAKVECHLIDDMVRIVSQTFKHYSAFGDFEVYNDGGRLNCNWDGTSCDWETYGLSSPEGPRVVLDEPNVVDIQKTELDAAAPRWRFNQFVGFLGDFINLFVSEPPSGDSEENSGKARVHINESGGVLVQSIDSVGLERCTRIAVPRKLLEPWDPKGDKANEELPFPPDLDPLKVWELESPEKAFKTLYQARDYVKWFGSKFSKAQFLRLNKDWSVAAESAVGTPDRLASQQKDKKDANDGQQEPPDEVYATIRILQDGSILLLDSYDNTISMSKTGVQLSSFRNLYLEAAGSINMVAGGDINMQARRNVDITAMKYGITMKAQTFFQQYCADGGILLKSDSENYPDILEDDEPDAEQANPLRIGGICLKSKRSCIRLISEEASVGIKSGIDTIISGPVIGLDANDMIQFGNFARFMPSFTILNSILHAKTAMINDLVIGNGYESIFEHGGHVPVDDEMLEPADLEDAITERFADFRNKKYPTDFVYRTKEEYVTEGNSQTAIQGHYETLTQQSIRLDVHNVSLSEQQHGTWDYEDDAKVETDEYNISHAWPGIAPRVWSYDPHRANSWEPDPRDPAAIPNSPQTLSLESFVINYAQEMQ